MTFATIMQYPDDNPSSPQISSHSGHLSPFPTLNSPDTQSLPQSPFRENHAVGRINMSTIEELLYEARSSHSALLASICAYVTESTETHLVSSTSSIQQYYEHILEQHRFEASNKIDELQAQLKDMTSKYEQLKVDYARLEEKLETRTNMVTSYINQHHIQRSDVKNKWSIVSFFRAWKSLSKRHTRAKRLEKYIERTETEDLLHQYFVHLQVNRLNEKAERKLSEVKFKHETLSNEMARGYESEITLLKQQNDEAQHQIQTEIEKRKHLEADMRTLFMQSVSQMNMQALSLFQKVEGSMDMSAVRDVNRINIPNPEEKATNDIFQRYERVGNPSILNISVAQDLDAGSTTVGPNSSSLSPQPHSVISSSSTIPFFSPMTSSGNGFQQISTPHHPVVSQQFYSVEGINQSQQQPQQQRFPNHSFSDGSKDRAQFERLSDMYKTTVPANQPSKTTEPNVSASSQRYGTKSGTQIVQSRQPAPNGKMNGNLPTMMSTRRVVGKK